MKNGNGKTCLTVITYAMKHFYLKSVKTLEKELADLISANKYPDPNIVEATMEKLTEKQRIASSTSIVPHDQTEEVKLGNAVEVILTGGKYRTIFIDGVGFGMEGKDFLPENHTVIPTNSPFGKAILGKKVGEEGSYTVGNLTFKFKVVKIIPYLEAVKIFFRDLRPKEEEVKEKLQQEVTV